MCNECDDKVRGFMRESDSKREDQIQRQQTTIRISIIAQVITVISMIVTVTWLVAKIDGKTELNRQAIISNEQTTSKVVAALDKVCVKLDKTNEQLNLIKGGLNPITVANQKQANIKEMVEALLHVKNSTPSKSVTVGK
jgi:hypothetical protein